MLPLEAQRRLLRELPDEIPIDVTNDDEYDPETGTYPGGVVRRRYPVEKWWAHEDREIEYPSIELEIINGGVRDDVRQPLDQHVDVVDVPEDPSIAYAHKRVERLYDDVVVRIADRGMSAGVTAAERARLYTDHISRFFRFDLGLLEPGERPGEIPMLIRVIENATDTSAYINETQVSRFEFTIRVHYVLTHYDDVDRVEAARIDEFEDHPDPIVASFLDSASSSSSGSGSGSGSGGAGSE